MSVVAGGPTPPQEVQPTGAFASYVPHDLKYSQDFEDSLMQLVLESDVQQDGIRVIPEDSNEQPVDGVSVRADAVSWQSLPTINEDELPLSLDDPRRIFASPIAGVKLTHPGGYLEGGPGLDPEMDTFPEDFLSNNTNARSKERLRKAVAKEIDASMELLRERLEARRRAKEKNEQIERELKLMSDDHSLELKIQRKMAEDLRVKKEAKEKRRMEREGG
ncbi:unnamed protein product [Zymoseptoria tritici ST99CH_3D7]|uniref:Uncharacterized protein n=2 Tax=Zymoseptoria tritici TaxID=1047171 RepID=F9X9Q9_ZYMTI|nr:uncharacterized protein MYCGRDRAFT_109211 [Zymoseptoria tritici IPO323]EGP88051.1 hypothetical protein MYCGRDRAFT_109211 [Zymoseptoria tritici IPO323]SMQ50126.1 unnamed protein product [Zymoseptoria tritici ST99CH_3D7]